MFVAHAFDHGSVQTRWDTGASRILATPISELCPSAIRAHLWGLVPLVTVEQHIVLCPISAELIRPLTTFGFPLQVVAIQIMCNYF